MFRLFGNWCILQHAGLLYPSETRERTIGLIYSTTCISDVKMRNTQHSDMAMVLKYCTVPSLWSQVVRDICHNVESPGMCLWIRRKANQVLRISRKYSRKFAKTPKKQFKLLGRLGYKWCSILINIIPWMTIQKHPKLSIYAEYPFQSGLEWLIWDADSSSKREICMSVILLMCLVASIMEKISPYARRCNRISTILLSAHRHVHRSSYFEFLCLLHMPLTGMLKHVSHEDGFCMLEE